MVVYAPVCFGAQDAHEVIEHKGEESLITAFAAFTLFGVAHRVLMSSGCVGASAWSIGAGHRICDCGEAHRG